MGINLLNRQQTEELMIYLYHNQKKTSREIQRIVRKSPRDIKVILNKVEPERCSLSIPAQAYRGCNYFEYERTRNNSPLAETNGNISPLAELHKRMKVEGLAVEHVIRFLLIANNDLYSIELICQNLKIEAADLNAKNLNAAETFQQLSYDISEESKVLEGCRLSCQKERPELDKLHLQRIGLESMVKQFQADNKTLQRIKEFVR